MIMADEQAQSSPEIEVSWGGLPLAWGGPMSWGSFGVDPETTIAHLAIDADYPDGSAVRVWTGVGDLTLGDDTYVGVGPEVISVRIGQATEKEDARLQVTLVGLTEPETRQAFYEFHGRVVVTVRLVYSVDGGVSWQVLPRRFSGLYSRPQIENDTVSFEVATYREQLDRGYEVVWSHENQRQDSGDLFFQHLEAIADGVDVRWPS